MGKPVTQSDGESPLLKWCEVQYNEQGFALLNGERITTYDRAAKRIERVIARFTSGSKYKDCLHKGYIVGNDPATKAKANQHILDSCRSIYKQMTKSMKYKTILTDHTQGILTVTLNRPEKLNALSPTLLAEVKSALQEVEQDQDTKVIVIKAAGRVFSAGYDLSEEEWIISQFPADFEHGVDLQQDREDILDLLDYWLELWRYPKPIITQVHGACLSGAGELLRCPTWLLPVRLPALDTLPLGIWAYHPPCFFGRY